MVWDPFTLVNPAQRDALTNFLDDPTHNSHYVEFDLLEKELFKLYMTNGRWLQDQVL